jgi:hypothetical protein
MNRCPVLGLLVAFAMSAALLAPAASAEAIFPLASQIGLVPPAGLVASTSFPGFEDQENNVFVRLVALPGNAYAEIEKTMTNDALRKQGMTVEKREHLTLPSGKALLLFARQDVNAARLRKWLLIAPFGELTALVSFEAPDKAAARYPDAAVRASLATVAFRSLVPDEEKLALLPFRLGDLAGMRLVRVVPGVALQLTDGPQDSLDAYGQPHLVISAASGGPEQSRDRDHFARLALGGLPPLKDVRIVSAESLRIGGQPGHEVRAEAKSPQTDADIQIVQWLRFGTGAYMRILGIAPKQDWTLNFTRFRAVRDALEPR